MKKLIDSEFNLNDNIIYLNHAAVSPWPARTAKAVQAFAEENMLQGSLDYPEWLETEANLRRQAEQLLNAGSLEDVALLKNTSEALSVVAYGLDWKEGDNIVSSDQEFPSNRIVWESLSKKGVEFREADLKSTGSPEDALLSHADSRTRLITISSVQFSSGLRVDLKRIGEFCKERGLLFCIDAIQSLGAAEFDLNEIHADFVMADGHKWMLGPEGLAIFYCRPDVRDRLNINQYGWHMIEAAGDFENRDWAPAESARRFECGSPNMLGIHALDASLSLLMEAGINNVEREVLERSDYLFEKINSQPELELTTSTSPGRYAGIVSFRHKNKDNRALFQHLTQNNVFCSLRSGSIRVSPHFYTPYEHLDRMIEMVMKYES
jgi:selenocysteine lyase/cysteine desulfurase